MSDADELAAIAATEIQRMDRLANLGDRDSAGPDAPPTPAAQPAVPAVARWNAGFWVEAQRVDANPGRVGGPIKPSCVGVHTTDMLPEEDAALVAAWRTRPGDGSCAHFLIGRDASAGVRQFVSVFRNANHLGGPGHGWFVMQSSPIQVHPNSIAVGVELHCAGGVRMVQGQWRLVEDGAAHGLPLPSADVTPDPERPGRGWHDVTPYQLERLTALLGDLRAVLSPMPAGTKAVAVGQVPDPFTVMPSARLVTHAQLDPVHRADPWHPVCDWLRLNYTALT